MELFILCGTLGIAFYICTCEFSSYIIHRTVRIKSFSVKAGINYSFFLVNETYLRHLLTKLFSNRKAVAWTLWETQWMFCHGSQVFERYFTVFVLPLLQSFWKYVIKVCVFFLCRTAIDNVTACPKSIFS